MRIILNNLLDDYIKLIELTTIARVFHFRIQLKPQKVIHPGALQLIITIRTSRNKIHLLA